MVFISHISIYTWYLALKTTRGDGFLQESARCFHRGAAKAEWLTPAGHGLGCSGHGSMGRLEEFNAVKEPFS